MTKQNKLKIAMIDNWGMKNSEISDEIALGIVPDSIKNNYDVVVDKDNPDIVWSCSFGRTFLNYDCFKILFCQENRVSRPDYFDLVFSPNKFPNYNNHFKVCFLPDVKDFLNIRKNKYYTTKKTKFCSFIYANKRAKARIVFCKKLMKYKHVDCLGRVLKNADDNIPENLKQPDTQPEGQLYVYKDYKFSIAFENSSDFGYICEKISEPLAVGTIPIYWGAPDVAEYINPECFINVNDFDSFEDCIDYVKKVDNDDELYQKYINAPIVLPDSKLYDISDEKREKWLDRKIKYMLTSDYKKVGKASLLDKIKYNLELRGNLIDRRLKQLFLSGVKMPVWEKILWIFR